MDAAVDRKYVLILALIAGLILVAGVLLKPHAAAPVSPQPSDLSSLQRQLRAEDLRGTVSFLAERAAARAAVVVRMADRNASGVRIEQDIVTVPSGPNALIPLDAVATTDAGAMSARARVAPAPQTVVLAVAKDPQSQMVWAPMIYQGEAETVCNGVRFVQVTAAIPNGAAYDGAAVFSLDGGLLGVVGRCGDTRIIVAAHAIDSVLASARLPENRLSARYGFAATSMVEAERSYFKADRGLIVKTVWLGSAADEGGLQPGDIIDAGTVSDLLAQLSGDAAPVLPVRRNGRIVRVSVGTQGPENELGMASLPGAQSLTAVRVLRDSACYRAGLRTGDRIVQLAGIRAPNAAQIRRTLDRPRLPLFIIFQRDRRESGVLISQ